MKTIYSCIIFILLFGCNSSDSTFEKEFYEKVTGIEFPERYKILTTIDNGEFLTITILELEKNDCMDFAKKYHFEPITENLNPNLFGIIHLDSIYRELPDKKRLIRNWGSKGKNHWIYLLDTMSNRLYCEVIYPDWSDN